jgi:hypothetical protein
VETEPRQGVPRELLAGFRYVIGMPWIWTGISIAAFMLMWFVPLAWREVRTAV